MYEDVQDLLDDDRWVKDDSLRLMMEKESVMWSMLAVDAPLAVRPGGVAAAAHVLGCLRRGGASSIHHTPTYFTRLT